ncbi:sigma 54-interacting transcriptional regulator [Tropicimonas sp. S265A]|uniref:sigma 54-interacting transcriptional regulator n=1 Tax=Tropicimonas sp. S265A TaxID=3415134 RepID=UPI003C7AE754
MLDETLAHDSLLDALPEPALVLDTRSDRIVAANRLATKLLDLPRHPPGFSSFLREGPGKFIVFLEEVDHRGRAWSRDVALERFDGAPLTCELRGSVIEAEGAPRVLLTFLDLDELERHAQIAEAAELHRGGLAAWDRAKAFFSELERQNQLILNAAGEGIYGVNAEGKTTFVNRAAQEMLGWTAEDLLGRDIHSKIHHHHLDGEVYHSHDCPIYRSFRFEQVHRIEDEVFWRKDGKPIRVEYVSTPIYDQQVLAGAVVIFRDITERKENERKLREALEQVAALSDRLEHENAYLQAAITSERAHHDIIGESPAIKQVLAKIDAVAQTDATVFLTGETGTGKALVASAIHKDSRRKGRALIHFKCGSVAPEALEAELFGQIKGALPGAVRDKPGQLELAHGGTLFLDDVEELPIEQQGKLLQALRTGTVTRAGDTRSKSVDLRVIAATTQPPEQLLSSGRLREDLLLYLNLFPISCAPLRDRTEDIPALATHLLQIACRRLNRKAPMITQGTMHRMVNYGWPGNVRELRNVIERAAIVSKGPKLEVEVGQADASIPKHASAVKTDAQMQQMVRANILACLRETEGRVAGPDGAAALLGLKPTTLYSRLKTYGISEMEWRSGT